MLHNWQTHARGVGVPRSSSPVLVARERASSDIVPDGSQRRHPQRLQVDEGRLSYHRQSSPARYLTSRACITYRLIKRELARLYGENDKLISPQHKNTRLRVNNFCATNPAVTSRERAPTPTTRASVTSPRSALSPNPGGSEKPQRHLRRSAQSNASLHYGRRCRSAEREKRQSRGAVRPRRKDGRGRVHPAGWLRDVCCVRAGGRPPPA